MVVLITRPEPDGSAFEVLLKEVGLQTVLSPVMQIRFNDVTPNLKNITGLAFTSANGVRSLLHALGQAGVGESDENSISTLPVYAIGPATHTAALSVGFSDVRIAKGDGVSLAELILGDIAADDVLDALIYHAAGSIRQGDLVRVLEKGGVRARRETLYRATPIEQMTAAAKTALEEKNVDACVAFFSPRSARLFLEQVQRAGIVETLAGARALCLSEPIAAELAGTRWKSVVIAKKPEASAVRDLLTP